MSAVWLENFVSESNHIEGIGKISVAEVQAHEALIEGSVTIRDLEWLVSVCAPGHKLRDKSGLNVFVGSHRPPLGGQHIRDKLQSILSDAAMGDPHDIHVRYEDLHPFTDGNGRSGRALWLWMMLRDGGRNEQMAKQLGFLHSFYYQTLAASDTRTAA